MSRSRAALERFEPMLHGRVIEINGHAKQSKRLADLASSFRTTEVLEFVLEAVQPKLIVCAGSAAKKSVVSLSLPWHPLIVEARHFIYWGHAYEQLLAAKVNSHV
mgnify:CR=1 FL=1